MEVTLPPLQAPRVVQEDSIADVTPQAYESETEDTGDPVYQLIEHFIIIISGYISVYYVYNHIIMFRCIHQGVVDCKSGGQCSDRASGQTMMASQIQHEGQAVDAILPAVRRSCTVGQFLAIVDKTTTIITINVIV